MRSMSGNSIAGLYAYDLSQTAIEQINNTTNTVEYLHHDQQGSTRLITGSTGKAEGKCTYNAYGSPTCEAALRPRSGSTGNTQAATPG